MKLILKAISFKLFILIIFSAVTIASSSEDEMDDFVKKFGDMKRPSESEEQKGSASVPSTPETKKVFTREIKTEPRVPKKYKFDVKIKRRYNKENKNSIGVYFSKGATLKCSGIEVSTPNDPNIFDGNSPLKDMNAFLIKRVKVVGAKNGGWNQNHLAANLFVLVNDERTDELKCIEGSILAEENDEQQNYKFYEFSVSPGNKNLNGRKIADFVSSEITEPAVLNLVKNKNYLPITQSSLRPIFDENNHGDRLALDTILANTDLFFNLLRKTAHRQDLSILGMGVRYYSSYDACNECFKKIYDVKSTIQEGLTHFAKARSFKIQDEEKPIPFFTLFYSTRPYKDSSYTLSWQYPEEEKKTYSSTLSPFYSFQNGEAKYTFELLKHVQGTKSHYNFLKNNYSKQLSIHRGTIELTSDAIYSYVSLFEPKGIAISYE